MNKQEKKAYLIGKMYDGAQALYDLFKAIKTDREVDPRELGLELERRYDLTPRQGWALQDISLRAARAIGIVRYLEHRFGLNEDETFRNPGRLHHLLFKGKTPKKLEARSYNFGVGFTRGVWTQKDARGVAYNSHFSDQLAVPLNETFSRLEDNMKNAARAIAFSIPHDNKMEAYAKAEVKRRKALDPRNPEKLTLAIFKGRPTAESVRQEVINHELRHVIDSIINGRRGFFVETQAYMPDMGNLAGLNRDIERKKIHLAKLEGYELQCRVSKPREVDKVVAAIARLREDVYQAEQAEKVLRKLLTRRGTDPEVVSYLFSTQDPRTLIPRIKESLDLEQTVEAGAETQNER